MTTPSPIDRTLTVHFRHDTTKSDHVIATLVGPGDDVLARVHGDSAYRAFANLVDHIDPVLDELDRKSASEGVSFG